MRLYPFHYAPPSYPLFEHRPYRSSPRSDSSHHWPRSSVINVPVVDHRSPPSPSPQASHAPPRASESFSPPVASPPTCPKRSFSDYAAATLIQARFRGFSIRRHQPLLHLRSIAAARRQLEDLRVALERPEFAQKLRKDDKERLRVTEAIMTIILNLDAIEGSIIDVRLRRKEATIMAISLQDTVDAIALQDEPGASDVNHENADHSGANGEFGPGEVVLDSENEDSGLKVVELLEEGTDHEVSQIESLPEDSMLLHRKSNWASPGGDGATAMEVNGSAIIAGYPSENASCSQVECSEHCAVGSLYKSNEVVPNGDGGSSKEEGTAALSGYSSETAATAQIECAEQIAMESTSKSKEVLPDENVVTSTNDIDAAALTGSSSENGCSAQTGCAEQRAENAVTEQTECAEQNAAESGRESFKLLPHKDSVPPTKEDSSDAVGGYSSESARNAQTKYAEQRDMQSERGCLEECLSRSGSIIALDKMASERLPFKSSSPGTGCAGAVTLSSQDNEEVHREGDEEKRCEDINRLSLTQNVMCVSGLGQDKEMALDNLTVGETSPCSLGHENVPSSVTNLCTKCEEDRDKTPAVHNAPTSECEAVTPEIDHTLEDDADSHNNVDQCKVTDCKLHENTQCQVLDCKLHENIKFRLSESVLQQLIEDNKQLKNLLAKLMLQSRTQSKVICALGQRLETLEHQQKLIFSQQGSDRKGRERKYPNKKSSRRPSFFEPLE